MRRICFIPLYLALLLLFNSSCSCTSHRGKAKTIAIDESWFPLQLDGRESAVTGFSTELLQEIGMLEKIPLERISVNWNDLVEGLQKHKYDAILSSIPPYIFNQPLYDFSELYLATGPVLVIPLDSKLDTLKKMKGREVAVLPGTNGAIIVEKYPDVIIRDYDSIPKALTAIVHGQIDGAIVDVLAASAYCKDLYHDQLRIASPPLNEEGLRLLTLHDASDLAERFNKGLEKVKSSGRYEKLLGKWSLRVYR